MVARCEALVRLVHSVAPVVLLLVTVDIGLAFASKAPGDDAPGNGANARAMVVRRQSAEVEGHIRTLHTRLRITAAQEPLWQPLASAMREGVANLDRVYGRRSRRYASMSAVDDLKSYAEVQEIEAQNVQNLITPFGRLYASFSPLQKRDADETFRRFTENAMKDAR